ncbi:MAG TPA: alpha/beta hydrolase [Abditibacteriaceae bacterium]|jgi:acetyl esterase/lipase
MPNNLCHVIGCAALLLLGSCISAQQNPPRNRPQNRPLPPGVKAIRDLEYAKDSAAQKLDLYLPEKTDAPLPLIIWVHGGAWLSGDKAQCPALSFTQNGYAVASLNYRLSQEAKFPAQIEDCKGAVRWLRAHAGNYNLDAARFGAWGSSAGGHLVALLGTAGDVKDLEGTIGGNTELSSRVQAVCDWFGPTDFTKMADFPSIQDHNAPDAPEARLIGGPVQENKDKAARANPITYVSKDDPPFLIMHGDKDPLVPLNQSELLRDALQKVEVSVQFQVIEGAGHGFGGRQINQTVKDFFDKHLKVK